MSAELQPIGFRSTLAALQALDALEAEITTTKSLSQLDTIARTAAAMQRFAPVKEVADRGGEVWTAAEIRLGEELTEIELAKGTRGNFAGRDASGGAIITLPENGPTLAELGLPGDAGKKRAARAKKLAALPKAICKALVAGLKSAGKGVTPNAILQQQRTTAKVNKKHAVAAAAFSENGPFGVVVIDPPWPMQKIDRDERPNQDAFDYPIMSETELAGWWEGHLADKVEADCHLFCWTTQKFLPAALGLVECWGFKYVLLMVWHKAGGFQPVDLPQYNCEFVVYARRGAPVFIDTTAFYCCFEGTRRQHSRKPDEFYEVIRRVTGGSRIDVFSRERREGFAQYGNELAKFDGEG